MVEEYICCCFTCFSDYHDSHLNSSTKQWDWIPALSFPLYERGKDRAGFCSVEQIPRGPLCQRGREEMKLDSRSRDCVAIRKRGGKTYFQEGLYP
jgi:hypothetical protein